MQKKKSLFTPLYLQYLVVFTDVATGYNLPDHNQHHCFHHAPTVKAEAATAVVVAPDDGV